MEEEIQLVYKKFKERERDRDRDEDRCRHRQSTLLDQFERLSIEIQLNQAILRRSLSETTTTTRSTAAATVAMTHQRRSVDERPKKLPMLLRSMTGRRGAAASEWRKKQPQPQPQLKLQQQKQRGGMRKTVEKVWKSIFRGKDRNQNGNGKAEKREENKMSDVVVGREATTTASEEVVVVRAASRSRSRRACLAELFVPGIY